MVEGVRVVEVAFSVVPLVAAAAEGAVSDVALVAAASVELLLVAAAANFFSGVPLVASSEGGTTVASPLDTWSSITPGAMVW